MAGTAPYHLDATFSDDETFAFSISFEMADGTDFPFDDYAIEYVVSQGGCPRLTLSQDAGISIQEPEVTFKAARGPLCVGEYWHGCRLRLLETGEEFLIFDGAVTIGEGGFQ